MKTIKKEFNSNVGNTMVIELYYDLGGMNYFSGKVEQRGYRISFTHAFINDGVEKITPMNNKNFKILVKETKRKSRKIEEKLYTMLIKYQDKLFNAFGKNNKQEVLNIINTF